VYNDVKCFVEISFIHSFIISFTLQKDWGLIVSADCKINIAFSLDTLID